MTDSGQSVDGIDHSYRVAGHYGGMWDNTEWMKTLKEAEQAYVDLKQGIWSQLAIERTDGTRKASPDSDEWYVGTGTDHTEGDDGSQ